ncbi:hypothetical protein NP882_000988 [Escherichia coli]|jgi:2-keto-3-deoxy-galactonokinase|uniref:hypothetical protein n=1 Tax=Escherichia coli TaxID=562 RepID=UPI0001DC39A8|nr:hypothetical protein [Escherichia coli]EIH5738727.1 hypothetical protein [Shigella flexneri]EFJ5910066.1 hypothetical protein [Escherichia coli]EFJ96341.1 hypothetical protein HMPREF9540_03654 [Escherichia coli MS 115-1]EFN5155032.1 hypothetical protein [Escherichia coli]EFO3457854.1 hypothetical protein [Escherichia coli]
MKEFKGTPGKWKYTVRNVNEMMTTFHGVTIGDTYIEAATRNEREDALLIAAAPDLLEALQLLLKQSKNRTTTTYPEWYGAVNKGLAAISKALGGE